VKTSVCEHSRGKDGGRHIKSGEDAAVFVVQDLVLENALFDSEIIPNVAICFLEDILRLYVVCMQHAAPLQRPFYYKQV
jgi:hypothetical protein